MTPFTQHTGVAALMLQSNIDTDAIIPSREMKRVSKKGLGEGLFANWRYTLPSSRELNPDFVLNRSEYSNTTILLGGQNFGCGSSREHAVWALTEYGIRCIIAPSFGSIFYNNCIGNGLLPIRLDLDTTETVAGWVKQNPQANTLSVDLEQCRIVAGERTVPFIIEADARDMLVQGLDRIDLTLRHKAAIDQFQSNHRQEKPWAVIN